ncbi:MAG TPA: zf-HC2 domain-containing protein [Candidatus Limnocylindrales bacterium]|nr:zf-HC2 domain-containing protein [Candidatus Limnocylindrales bacterium]
MSLRGGRPRRPDAWSDAHDRARFRTAERLDGPIDATESAWLDDHLAACPACSQAATEYAAQRLELRALADRPPVPPRDLWARTAAAIEQEAAFREKTSGRRNPRSLLAPYALLSAALVVAVVVGTLTSSRPPVDGGTAASSGASTTQGDGTHALPPAATPVPIGQKTVKWITQDANGDYRYQTAVVEEVCPEAAEPCDTTAPTEDRPVDLNGEAQTVFGSPDGAQLIVVGDNGTPQTGKVSVLKLDRSAASASPSPSVAPSTPPASTASPSTTVPPTSTPTTRPTPTPTPATVPTPTPTSPPASGSPAPSPSVAVSPSPSDDGSVQIAHDVTVVGQAAAYSPNGAWFAFTARPADGSAGPDIYAWRVGDPEAHAVTTDHRSELGSWSGDVIVGSTVLETPDGPVGSSFILDPETMTQTLVPQTGNAWRPSVDPFGRQAVYWAGHLRATTDGPGFAPDAGRLVLGAWGTGSSAPTDGPFPTAPADQEKDRHETTIAAGQMNDWDARWDATGTKLAIWIADAGDPTFGRLSLYEVDPFDGRVDLKKPLIDARLAKAGYALSEGKLVWAEPAPDGGSGPGPILMFAWTDKGSGTIETVPGDVIVIR